MMKDLLQREHNLTLEKQMKVIKMFDNGTGPPSLMWQPPYIKQFTQQQFDEMQAAKADGSNAAEVDGSNRQPSPPRTRSRTSTPKPSPSKEEKEKEDKEEKEEKQKKDKEEKEKKEKEEKEKKEKKEKEKQEKDKKDKEKKEKGEKGKEEKEKGDKAEDTKEPDGEEEQRACNMHALMTLFFFTFLLLSVRSMGSRCSVVHAHRGEQRRQRQAQGRQEGGPLHLGTIDREGAQHYSGRQEHFHTARCQDRKIFCNCKDIQVFREAHL